MFDFHCMCKIKLRDFGVLTYKKKNKMDSGLKTGLIIVSEISNGIVKVPLSPMNYSHSQMRIFKLILVIL